MVNVGLSTEKLLQTIQRFVVQKKECGHKLSYHGRSPEGHLAPRKTYPKKAVISLIKEVTLLNSTVIFLGKEKTIEQSSEQM